MAKLCRFIFAGVVFKSTEIILLTDPFSAARVIDFLRFKRNRQARNFSDFTRLLR